MTTTVTVQFMNKNKPHFKKITYTDIWINSAKGLQTQNITLKDTAGSDHNNKPVNPLHWPNAGLLLVRRRRRRANNNLALGQCIVFAGKPVKINFSKSMAIQNHVVILASNQ